MQSTTADTLLLVTDAALTGTALEPLCHLPELQLIVCPPDEALGRLERLLTVGSEPAAVVFAPDLPKPLALARQVYGLAPLSQLLFVVAPDNADFRRQMLLAPMIGTYWTVIPPEGEAILKAVQDATRLTRRRNQHRTTLDRLKLRLEREPTRDESNYRKLVISDRYLASILEHAPETIVSLDPQGTLVSWNRGAVVQFGYTQEEVLGQPAARLLTPDAQAAFAVLSEKVLQEGVAVRQELECVCADGSLFPAEITLAPVQDASSRTIALSLIVRNISERKRAERAFIEANAQLEQRVQERTAELRALNKELETFSYSVSHDLRAPLRGINGFSEALLEDYADTLDPAARRYLERIATAAQRMGNLIDDLLGLARLSRSEMRQERVDLTGLARGVLENLAEGSPEREVRLEVQEGVQATGDTRLLRIALENLLHNAWKFTAQTPKACIRFGVERGDKGSLYFVQDNGAGFDMLYATRLFLPFQRLHEASSFEGTGIGLATVQRIIGRHNGRIWADAKVGEGATFYFTIGSSN